MQLSSRPHTIHDYRKMQLLTKVLLFICVVVTYLCTCETGKPDNSYKYSTVAISVLVRNKAHALPYFLSCLSNLDYPKDRIYLWIYSDFNSDNSDAIISEWVKLHGSEYNGMHITTNSSTGPLHPDENGPLHWSPDHFQHVIRLREEALGLARRMWADYIFMLDADAFLVEPTTLKFLVEQELPVVAPMLASDGLYSNFWCGMTEDYYYKRTDDYKAMLYGEKKGCLPVPMIHSAVLVDLRDLHSDLLTYDPGKIKNYDGPIDDIIAFAISAKKNGIPLNVCNEFIYGFIPIPLSETDDLSSDKDQIQNIKLLAISRNAPLPLNPELQKYITPPKLTKLGCDEVFMINLERRTERRRLMELSFIELGISATLFKAIDGRSLDMKDLSEYSIKFMPGYEDPFHKRSIKAGEVGCFLSHYFIWKKIVERRFQVTLVLEDDIQFQPYFTQTFHNLLDEIKDLKWDLVYIGRKILIDSEDQYVTPHTIRPLYSYWTLGYLISQSGAQKLVNARPLDKLVPVDEFLPIMFDQHPNKTWKSYFPNRELFALSAAPLLVYPTHYTGQEGYISDTEDSTLLLNKGSNPKNEL